MPPFARSFIAEWRRLKLPQRGETFLLAVSGGADSVGLALVVADLRRAGKLAHRFIVAHFNHALRGAESELDAQFVRDLTRRLEMEFILGKPENSLADQNDNLEQAARRARYEFLKRAATEANAFAVLTAHTINDQAETFLLNLVRGSGAGGLSAMRPVRPIDKDAAILLARPFLNWATREMTEDFCRAREIDFRRDRMNEDSSFTRVRIRKTLLPLLREFNPKIVETLAQTANLLREERELSDKFRAALLPAAEEAPKVKNLKELSAAARRSVLRAWIERERGDLRRLGLKHFEAVERLVLSEKSGRTIELPGGGRVVKTGGRLLFKNSKVEKSPPDD